MSFEMWLPPTGTAAMYEIEPSTKTPASVVPPPRSTSATPMSFSAVVRTASPAAIGWTTSASMPTPTCSMQRERLWIAVWVPVTTVVSTSRRRPSMPAGLLIPSWPSITKWRGTTWITSRSCGMLTTFAASSARSMSSSVMTLSVRRTATTPWLLVELMWAPEIPTNALMIL